MNARTCNRCFALLLVLICATMTSQLIHVVNVRPVENRRLDVTPHDVMTHSSLLKCSTTCRQTSWCVSANMSPDNGTCELLSVEVSVVTSLELAEGWNYLREWTTFLPHLFSVLNLSVFENGCCFELQCRWVS